MAGIFRVLFSPVSGEMQLNSGLSESRLTTQSCWHAVPGRPHTDDPNNQQNLHSVERNQ